MIMLEELKPSVYLQNRGNDQFYFGFLVRIPNDMIGVLTHTPPIGGQPRKFRITVSARPGQTHKEIYSFFEETIIHKSSKRDKYKCEVYLVKSAKDIYASKSVTPNPGTLGGSYDDPDGFPGDSK